MRPLKFRQPRLDDRGNFIDWFYWGFIDDGFIAPLRFNIENYQFTGLKDKNGKEEVYQDDLMKDLLHIYRVVWDETNARWFLVDVVESKRQFKGHAISLLKKVGDIHTTPQLMEQSNGK